MKIESVRSTGCKDLLRVLFLAILIPGVVGAADWWKPYSSPCVERAKVYEFTMKPVMKYLGNDKYELTFAVRGFCDVTVGIVDQEGKVVRHLASGVLGANAPAPFHKNSLKQTLNWNGKDDLDVYVKDPQQLKVRVMLGLKPTFDKRIGGTSGNHLPGFVWGMTIGPDGAYVISKGSHSHGHLFVRKFDHEGKYIQSLVPPPANLPESKLEGCSYVEYEPGKRAVHGPHLTESVSRGAHMFIPFVGDGGGSSGLQPVLVGKRLFLCSSRGGQPKDKNRLIYLRTDGSTEVKGMHGRELSSGYMSRPFFAASPDGKTLYVTGQSFKNNSSLPVVLTVSTDGDELAKTFAGDPKKQGNDNKHLNNPRGVDCDAKGRVYVADNTNARIQVFSPKGKYLKSIPVDRPEYVCVHKKTGAIYVLHMKRIKGRSVSRLVKFTSFENPKEEFHVLGFDSCVMALDSWTPKPRLWLAKAKVRRTVYEVFGEGSGIQIFEEQGKGLKKVFDFDEVAKREAGKSYFGRFRGAGDDDRGINTTKSTCDPTLERLYYRNSLIFDLKTGAYQGQFHNTDWLGFDDIAVDKRGFMHGHSWGSGPTARVWRVDPSRAKVENPKGNAENGGPIYFYPEVPYDYGVARGERDGHGWKGALPVKSQACAHPWQHGLGVNMRGDVAVSSRITYVPKMEAETYKEAHAGQSERKSQGYYVGGSSYACWKTNILDVLKKGHDLYHISRQPGIPLYGDTIWTFDSNGEQRHEAPSAVLGGRLAGVQMDEDFNLYFATFRSRMVNGKPFLAGRGGTFGTSKDLSKPHARLNKFARMKNLNPFLGTYIKSKPNGVAVRMPRSPVLLDPLPTRPAELHLGGKNWIEGTDWLYAGASPIVAGGCECPSSRGHLDWYKRSYVQEVYRHSIGILDTNGNLIMHLGTYGNFDSANGAKSKIPVGGDNISTFMARYLGGTDNYLVFNDWGERVVVLKLNYHAEAMVKIVTE